MPAARQDDETLRALADYAIDRHYPELADAPRKYLEFFRAVIDRQAALIARWQLVGFIHGVMNTDNMAISGETIDYGPCAFMNAYDPDTVFSSIDQRRPLRLRQPARDRAVEPGPLRRDPAAAARRRRRSRGRAATARLAHFPARSSGTGSPGCGRSWGCRRTRPATGARRSLLDWMQTPGPTSPTRSSLTRGQPLAEAGDRGRRPGIAAGWSAAPASRSRRPTREPDAAVNPAVIPRNHRVEEALAGGDGDDDLSVLQRLLDVLASPYDHDRDVRMFSAPAPGHAALPHVLRHIAGPWTHRARTVQATRIRGACPSSPVSAWAATRSSPRWGPAPWARSIARATRASIGRSPSRSHRPRSRRPIEARRASSRKRARSRP